jgi:methionyl aminopeptidase
MRIPILTKDEIKKMRTAGKIAGKVLTYIGEFVQPGVSTEKLNQLCHDFIIEHGCIPAPLNYKGFPKSVCTSVNNVICHGIPSEKDVLQEGDIINIDVTVIKNGYHGDTSKMFGVGAISEENKLLINRTEKAMLRGIEAVKPGRYVNDIGIAIEKYISKFDYGIVTEYTGHGIGKKFHDEPTILHFDTGYKGARLQPGMAFTVEPMINDSPLGDTRLDPHDGWTVRTVDGSNSAQWEHTVLVTETGVEILTLREE